jgi:hypothetical protein
MSRRNPLSHCIKERGLCRLVCPEIVCVLFKKIDVKVNREHVFSRVEVEYRLPPLKTAKGTEKKGYFQ